MCERLVAKRKMTFDNSNKTKRKHNTRLLNACMQEETNHRIDPRRSVFRQSEMVTTIPKTIWKRKVYS